MGSLFQLRDYWYASFPGEEFAGCAFVHAHLDSTTDDGADELLAVGSFQGYLRLIAPSPARGAMQARDVLYEQRYGEPILQLAFAPFEPGGEGDDGDRNAATGMVKAAVTTPALSTSPTLSARGGRNLLAVLLPHRLLLLRVRRHARDRAGTVDEVHDTADELSMYCECSVYFETHFEQSMFNFAHGPFGGAGYSMICVQSMDGQFVIVDHNKVVCRRYLPLDQFLLPYYVTYSALTDCFYTGNSAQLLSCYPYTSLVNSTACELREQTHDAAAPLTTGDDDNGAVPRVFAGGSQAGAKLRPTWAYNLGDEVVAIEVCRLTRGMAYDDADIVVLCPYTLHVLALDGSCRLMRLFEVEAVTLCAYPLPETGMHNLIISYRNCLISVFEDVALDWSATLPAAQPLVGLGVARVCGREGMIVTLTAQGAVTASYLGTDPAEETSQPLESRAQTYNDMLSELRTLQQGLQREDGVVDGYAKAHGDDVHSPSLLLDDDKTPKSATCPLLLSLASPVLGRRGGEDGKAADFVAATQATLAVTVTLRQLDRSQTTLVSADDETVLLQAHTTPPVVADSPCVVLEHLRPGQSVTVPFTFHVRRDEVVAGDDMLPSSLEVRLVALLLTPEKTTMVAQATSLLPFALVARPVEAVKFTNHVLQLNTDQDKPPSLRDIFADLVPLGPVGTNVLSVRYSNEVDATVLVSRNAARFKLQSSKMEGLWLLCAELVRRLRAYYHTTSSEECNDHGDEVKLSISDDVPIKVFFSIIHAYRATRRELATQHTVLEHTADFFRAVQKRLLVRYRNHTPAPQLSIAALYAESYKALQHCAEAVTASQRRHRQACARLNACAQLVFLWLCIAFPDALARTADRRLLKTVLACAIDDNLDGATWEELAEVALMHALRLHEGSLGATLASPLTQQQHDRGVLQLQRCIELAMDRIRHNEPIVLC